MKPDFRFRRLGALFWLLLFTAYSVAAVGVVILDAADGNLEELSGVSGITIHASEDMRSLGASQLAAVYRVRSGAPFMSLPPGSTVKVVWPDGTSEYVVVVDPAANVGTRPIAGTQRDADGNRVDDSDSQGAGESGAVSPGRAFGLPESALR